VGPNCHIRFNQSVVDINNVYLIVIVCKELKRWPLCF